MTKSLSLLVVGAVALSLAPAIAFAETQGEVSAIANQANLAAGSASIAGVHLHLQDALNCMVGPNGAGFDASANNPCKDSGQGAIADAADAGVKAKLQTASDRARAGLAAKDFIVAKKTASDIVAMLK